MKINYQLLTEDIIKNQPKRSRILLQSCCGPCSSYVLQFLCQHFDVDVLFYNPNIQPESEYALRLSHQRRLIAEMCPEVGIVETAYDGEVFEEAVHGLEDAPEGGARCAVCFELRLAKTAEVAKERGYDYFGTTLTVSPHKNASLINAIGEEISKTADVAWLPSDFKKKNGYKISIELAKKFELYRQEYCGCFYSISPHD